MEWHSLLHTRSQNMPYDVVVEVGARRAPGWECRPVISLSGACSFLERQRARNCCFLGVPAGDKPGGFPGRTADSVDPARRPVSGSRFSVIRACECDGRSASGRIRGNFASRGFRAGSPGTRTSPPARWLPDSGTVAGPATVVRSWAGADDRLSSRG